MEPSKTENLARELTVREAKLPEKVREWRAKLSTKAKQERRFRFYSLYGLISHLDTLRGGVGTGSRQPRGAWSGRGQLCANRTPRTRAMARGTWPRVVRQKLPVPSCAAGLYPQGKRQTATARGSRPSGTEWCSARCC